ncbi:MAG TPA: cell division protein ZapA [Polyangiaceae bacterium]|jgi:cell division protein ZapA|nr:cell division protein ZapA [Polyangiaceae bacterium]
MSRTVEVRVAGQSYRVVSSAPEGEVRRLAEAVNAKLAELVPKGRGAPPNALLLAAIALAHDVEEEREKRETLERRARDWLRRMVTRIDEVLEAPDAEGAGGGGHGAKAPGGVADEALAVGRMDDETPAARGKARPAGGVDDGAERAAGEGIGAGPGEVSRET